MAQKGTTGWASTVLLMLFALTLSCSSPSLAQSQQKERFVGDWELFEEGYGSKGPTGVPDTARTSAFKDRTAQLWVSCSTYEVQFDLRWDDAFITSFPEGAFESVAFINIDRVDVFRSVVLTRHLNGGSTFIPYTRELMRGATLMICPKKDDKDPACVAFSLKGITAALKAICPKR